MSKTLITTTTTSKFSTYACIRIHACVRIYKYIYENWQNVDLHASRRFDRRPLSGRHFAGWPLYRAKIRSTFCQDTNLVYTLPEKYTLHFAEKISTLHFAGKIPLFTLAVVTLARSRRRKKPRFLAYDDLKLHLIVFTSLQSRFIICDVMLLRD